MLKEKNFTWLIIKCEKLVWHGQTYQKDRRRRNAAKNRILGKAAVMFSPLKHMQIK